MEDWIIPHGLHIETDSESLATFGTAGIIRKWSVEGVMTTSVP